MKKFEVHSNFDPSGDQAVAIEKLSSNLIKGMENQTLLGVTGSGKTFTMAKVIEKINKPTLIISHNKTLSAQLYREFCDFFPNNAVEYFVSYYDYYQPEAYVPSKDLYIEKDASINDEIDMMRLSATSSLLERNDVIVVATVSCIYGLGSPTTYRNMSINLEVGANYGREQLILDLVRILYERDDNIFDRSRFRVRGDIIDIFPAYVKTGIRVEFFGETIESIKRFDILNNSVTENINKITIFPAKHFVSGRDAILKVVPEIKKDLEVRVGELIKEGKDLEAKRLKTKIEYDIDMMLEVGYCKGIENYSRYFDGRKVGAKPSTLLNFFPKDFLLFIDESHVTIPQIGGMYEGDKARKSTLVEYGFRLSSALDNRPLFFEEFTAMLNQTVFVSATPREYELGKSGAIVEQIIRPTGLIDPEIIVKPTERQMDDLLNEISVVVDRGERVLVTTLTKRMAEDLADFLSQKGVNVRYLHSDIETIERVEILQELREGVIDVLIGINLLREGLDLPEVSLVAILDADKIGFLRSTTSLIQTIGRAARNVNGKVIMYADRFSDAMKVAITETKRRRALQRDYNEKHGITPKSIEKKLSVMLERQKKLEIQEEEHEMAEMKTKFNLLDTKAREEYVKILRKKMLEAAESLEFEKATVLRDEIRKIEKGDIS